MALLKQLRRIAFGTSVAPYCSERTFFLWEPCSSSHAEVVPGFARYLLDAGYDVSVLLTPARLDEGLFARFTHPRLHFNRLSQWEIRRHFKRFGLGNAAGVMVTTAGKIADPGDYRSEVAFFGRLRPSQRVLLVEHDARAGIRRGTLSPSIVTLRELGLDGASTTAINPHCFGDVAPHRKHGRTRFATVGALRSKRRNSSILVEAVSRLASQGIHDFVVDVVGRGGIRGVPGRLGRHLVIHGRLDFAAMYGVVEAADFMLPLLDPENESHDRYVTTGTSGTFQLAYGFCKPCLIERKFAAIHGLGDGNAIVYDGNAGLADAMREGIACTESGYADIRSRLEAHAADLANASMRNLRALLQ